MKPRQGSERNYEDFPDALFALITSYRKAERRSAEHHASTLTLQVSSYLPGVALRKQQLHVVYGIAAVTAPPIIRRNFTSMVSTIAFLAKTFENHLRLTQFKTKNKIFIIF